MPSVPSPASKSDNSITKEHEKIDATINIKQVPSKVPSTNNGENQATKPGLDDTDRIDGTLQQYSCRYCTFSHTIESELIKHSVNSHPKEIVQPDESILKLNRDYDYDQYDYLLKEVDEVFDNKK